MYKFKINKSLSASNEEFELAVKCARDCIDSVLGHENLNVIVFEDTIIIKEIDESQSINMTLSECKEKIKGCFLSSSGDIYPEFKIIIPD